MALEERLLFPHKNHTTMASNSPLSSSPTSVSFFLAYDTAYEEIDRDSSVTTSKSRSSDDDDTSDSSSPITMKEFTKALPPILRKQKEYERKSSSHQECQTSAVRGTKDDPVNALFSRLDLTLGEWKKYAMFESKKNYTRNLIATDDETFTLLLLCWNPGKESPIHDHPCGERECSVILRKEHAHSCGVPLHIFFRCCFCFSAHLLIFLVIVPRTDRWLLASRVSRQDSRDAVRDQY
mmetsp:Transcript_23131/g.49957  ORF Transcript_23131/g.49957 Transcript_23131/m.49957 type:complete len:237 (+) Transcript_23131:1574-2284(+)